MIEKTNTTKTLIDLLAELAHEADAPEASMTIRVSAEGVAKFFVKAYGYNSYEYLDPATPFRELFAQLNGDRPVGDAATVGAT